MTWQEKMQFVLSEVTNEEFIIEHINAHEFKIIKVNTKEQYYKIETLYEHKR